MLSELVFIDHATGQWEDALLRWSEIPRLEELPAARAAAVELLMSIPPLLVARGEGERAAEVVASYAGLERSSDLQESTSYHAARAVLLGSEGRFEEALESGRKTLETMSTLSPVFPGVKMGFVEAAGAALALGKLDVVEEFLEIARGLGAGETSPFWRAHAPRIEAHLAATRGEDGIEERFERASTLFRASDMPFWLAVTLVEHGEWLLSAGRGDKAAPLLGEARDLFERLGARRWLERLDALGPAPVARAER
jgi:hypothetical protein